MSTNSTDLGTTPPAPTTTTSDIDKEIDFDELLNVIEADDDDAPPVPAPPRPRGRPPKSNRRITRERQAPVVPATPAAPAASGPADFLAGLPKASDMPAKQPDPDEMRKKVTCIRQIGELQKKLGAVGSGLRPTTFDTLETLQAEVQLLNENINSRRGDAAIKGLIIAAMPYIEKAITSAAPREQLDVSSYFHLTDEVKENWTIFEGAATQISIMYGEWFSVNPFVDLAKCTYACIDSVDAKNKKMRERAAAGQPLLMPRVPQNSPNDDDDVDDKAV